MMLETARRAMSVIEVTMTVVIIGVLSAVAVTSFANTRERSNDAGSERVLESVAGAQEAYHRSRGQFATSGSGLAAMGTSEVALTSEASTGPGMVSVAAVQFDGTGMLGLAVRSSSGSCLTLLVAAPGENTTFEVVPSADQTEGEACTASRAVPR